MLRSGALALAAALGSSCMSHVIDVMMGEVHWPMICMLPASMGCMLSSTSTEDVVLERRRRDPRNLLQRLPPPIVCSWQWPRVCHIQPKCEQGTQSSSESPCQHAWLRLLADSLGRHSDWQPTHLAMEVERGMLVASVRC